MSKRPAPDVADLCVEPYTGPRATLRPLFELAEDSSAQLDTYLTAGRVLVARRGTEVIGHLQLVDTDRHDELEIKNMAVREDQQGQGIGARLVRAAIELATAESASVLVVATAAADTGNLRFYQRQGFRMRTVERDAFTDAVTTLTTSGFAGCYGVILLGPGNTRTLAHIYSGDFPPLGAPWGNLAAFQALAGAAHTRTSTSGPASGTWATAPTATRSSRTSTWDTWPSRSTVPPNPWKWTPQAMSHPDLADHPGTALPTWRGGRALICRESGGYVAQSDDAPMLT